MMQQRHTARPGPGKNSAAGGTGLSEGAERRSAMTSRELRLRYAGGPAVTTGLALAAAILLAWLATYLMALFSYAWGPHSLVTAPLLAATLCWLYVGLFIIAHDCMHGSLLPGRPQWNRLLGRACLLLYAGFSYDELKRQHHQHHRHAGTPDDPDFDERQPHSAGRWYTRFFVNYFAPRQAALMAAATLVYLLLLDVDYANLLAFWALPALLSSVQLFYFGTYQPHRPRATPFADRHRAHNSGYGWWLSLLTCFHFGHHRAHHRHPCVPWWGLPAITAAEERTQWCGPSGGVSQRLINPSRLA